jgi:hypothetical protein
MYIPAGGHFIHSGKKKSLQIQNFFIVVHYREIYFIFRYLLSFGAPS